MTLTDVIRCSSSSQGCGGEEELSDVIKYMFCRVVSVTHYCTDLLYHSSQMRDVCMLSPTSTDWRVSLPAATNDEKSTP